MSWELKLIGSHCKAVHHEWQTDINESLALGVIWLHPECTLNDDEVNALFTALASELQATLRQ